MVFFSAKEGEFYIKEFLIIDDWYDGRPGYWTLEIGRATGRFASSVLRLAEHAPELESRKCARGS